MLLQVNNIDVAYDEFQVIWNVSISIDQGEMVALLGPNGSGKSTILNSISNLIQPKIGEVLFDNKKYIMLISSIILLVLGFFLMSGGGASELEFNSEIFSARRIIMAPIIIIAFIISGLAIMIKK